MNSSGSSVSTSVSNSKLSANVSTGRTSLSKRIEFPFARSQSWTASGPRRALSSSLSSRANCPRVSLPHLRKIDKICRSSSECFALLPLAIPSSLLLEEPRFHFIGQRRGMEPIARAAWICFHPVADNRFHLASAHVFIANGNGPLRRRFRIGCADALGKIADAGIPGSAFRQSAQPGCSGVRIVLGPAIDQVFKSTLPGKTFGKRCYPLTRRARIFRCPLRGNGAGGVRLRLVRRNFSDQTRRFAHIIFCDRSDNSRQHGIAYTGIGKIFRPVQNRSRSGMCPLS